MAKFTQSGLYELMVDIDRLRKQLDKPDLYDEVLEAGAEVIKEKWKDGIKKAVKPNGRSTGELERSIRIKKSIKKFDDISTATIAPDGYDENTRVPNMVKAYMLHYGNSGQAPTRFVDAVEEDAKDETFTAMQEVVNNYLEKEGF